MAKVLISLDQSLIDRIDREAQQRKMTRSALIAELAVKGLQLKGPGADPRVREAIKHARELLKDTPAGDSTEWIRQDRDSH